MRYTERKLIPGLEMKEITVDEFFDLVESSEPTEIINIAGVDVKCGVIDIDEPIAVIDCGTEHSQ